MRLRTRLAALASIPALAAGIVLATATASNAATAGNAATANLSFSSSAGNSAHWNATGTAVVLDMNRANAAPGQGGTNGGYAVASLHHTPSTLPNEAPTMTATNFGSGTPRLAICNASSECIWGYPTGPGGSLTFDSNTQFVPYGSSWATAVADANAVGFEVSSVFVVADASQATPYESIVSSLQYNGATYIP